MTREEVSNANDALYLARLEESRASMALAEGRAKVDALRETHTSALEALTRARNNAESVTAKAIAEETKDYKPLALAIIKEGA